MVTFVGNDAPKVRSVVADEFHFIGDISELDFILIAFLGQSEGVEHPE